MNISASFTRNLHATTPARANKSKKNREQAIKYLNRAIEIDPNYKAGRKRAEELKEKYGKK
jgi:hypothetical protein